jgi:hypothetical protein
LHRRSGRFVWRNQPEVRQLGLPPGLLLAERHARARLERLCARLTCSLVRGSDARPLLLSAARRLAPQPAAPQRAARRLRGSAANAMSTPELWMLSISADISHCHELG